MNQSTGGKRRFSFTGRMAGWSARHSWVVLAATVVFLVVAFLLNSSLGVKTSTIMGAGEARQARDLVEERFEIVEPADELILFSNPNLDVDDPAYRCHR